QGWQWLFPILAIAATATLWMIRKRWRGPLAAWLFFCGTLAPILGFVNVYMFRFSFVADHLQYLASLGIIVLAAAAVTRVVDRARFPTRGLLVSACMLVVLTLAALTFKQSKMYANAFALYETSLKLNPNSWMVHNNLGLALADAGKPQDAIPHYLTAI